MRPSSATLVNILYCFRLIPVRHLSFPQHPLLLPTFAFHPFPALHTRRRPKGNTQPQDRTPFPLHAPLFSHSNSYSSPCLTLFEGQNNYRSRHHHSIAVTSKVTCSIQKALRRHATMALSYDVLSEQNATTTNAIIDHYSSSPEFLTLSQAEGALILQRDEEDASKLQKGIDIAKEKGVIDPTFVPEDYITVDVLGKTPDQVAEEILARVRGNSDKRGAGGGGVVVLCGLSGTGKVS